ncbi:ribulose-phosphate 3-epimerase [symbiont of Argiope bruennichi]|uniref:ribulose-phosphate 3-epimerase n=1 Tax=symbiont of Argiope bruennichi TaxID=2810479 RepID=UPI003DA39DBA
MKVSVSVLSLDFTKAKEEMNEISKVADFIHYDVMDGRFAPNISFGPKILKDLATLTPLKFKVHLMVIDPVIVYRWFLLPSVETIIFHFESLNYYEIPKFILELKTGNVRKKVGISIETKTNVEQIFEYLHLVDEVLIMSVKCGFSGQLFDPSSILKIKKLVHFRALKNLNFKIAVDGGINDETGAMVAKEGCDILIAGSYIFENKGKEIKKRISFLKELSI